MAVYCAKHPKVETALSCTRCATPICPDCSVSGAVGFLCRQCAFGDGNPLFKVRPERLALSILAGLVAGIGVGFLLQALAGAIFIIFFACPLIGGFLGEVILRASGYKRGRLLEWIAGGSVIVGALVAALFNGALILFVMNPAAGDLSLALFLLAVILTAGAAIARIRYL